jgi:hypothetical protein
MAAGVKFLSAAFGSLLASFPWRYPAAERHASLTFGTQRHYATDAIDMDRGVRRCFQFSCISSR